MMVRRNILLIAALAFGLSSCGDKAGEETGNTDNSQVNQSQSVNSNGTSDGGDAAQNAQQSQNGKPKLERTELHKKFTESRPELSKERNTTSPYKYIQTSEEFSQFHRIVAQTSFAKYMHGKPVTVFAPTNMAMEKISAATLERLTMADDAGVEREAFVARHMVNLAVPATKLDEIPDMEDMRGQPLQVTDNKDGSYTINGNIIRPTELQLGSSILIAVDEVLPADVVKVVD